VKQLFALYTIIGLILTPFIYSNNAQGYRSEKSSAYGWGKALGGAFYWPSYLFSIEPEADGESLESFEKSIIDIVNYRNDKLFTGARSSTHGYMVFKAISSCMGLEYIGKEDISSLYEKIVAGNIIDKTEAERIAKITMEKMDGYDFSDIIEAGAECEEELQKK
jgi:hypothetical protein